MSEDPLISRLYVGEVMHLRMAPRLQLRYRVFSLWLDIDRIGETCAGLRLLSRNRWNLFSFYDRDHGARDGAPLRPWIEAQLAAAGIAAPDRIMLLSFPRILGYVFNPLSMYLCWRGGTPHAVIYEVRNTFGGLTPYALPLGAPEGGAYRQDQDKAFFVSPFIDMAQHYRFSLRIPGARLGLHIRETARETGALTLIAAQTGRARALTDTALARLFFTHPLMTLKVIGGIHYEALRLWRRGARFYRPRDWTGPAREGKETPV